MFLAKDALVTADYPPTNSFGFALLLHFNSNA